ncbi:hypothetical protein PV08_01255 [Exophiala spinifera]|uniref:Hypercellular protein HypA n=1 Tax=Exophiala spinifera TaxID=91928 RepID=A0A0D2BP33_9EURO|nr:uncharacterized protein PV08_01255 [Exophiala spinifera]KIW20678.1 hypothetical protein PV08_01255 [Exophiala spinifera]
MGYNPFDPIAGAKVNVLCVPAGQITPDRFQRFVKTLQKSAIIPLEDVEPSATGKGTGDQQLIEREACSNYGSPERQDGQIFYDISTYQDARRPDFFPFDTNSRSQILLGLIDGHRVEGLSQSASLDQAAPHGISAAHQSIKDAFLHQSPSIPGLLVRQLIWFGSQPPTDLGQDPLFVPDEDNRNAAHDVMVSLSRMFMSRTTDTIDELKNQPISMVPGMVPGVNSSLPLRGGRTPNLEDGNSNPTSTRSPNATPVLQETEAQSETSRGRFNIIQGMLRLQNGLWTHALDCLSDGISIAQNGHDHLWHGKALESLLVCMIILSWSNSSFTIPQVCRSLPNRNGYLQTDSGPKSAKSGKALAQLMPPMVETILELYAKVSNLDLGGSLQDVLREARVRLVNLLVCVKRNGNILSQECLNQIVTGQRGVADSRETSGEPVAISKAGMANILIETLQAAQSSNSIGHYTTILVAVSSSLSTLGLDRKHAFYLKMLMQQLVPKLIEARKVGASEVGVHPAAGLPPVSNASQGIIPEMAAGTRLALDLAAAAYGLPLSPVPNPQEVIPANLEVIRDKLQAWAIEHSFGDTLLKIEMLRICVVACDALPDIPASLHFTSSILRTAKQVITMPLQEPCLAIPLITAEEQSKFVESLKRAIAAASRIGESGYRAEYWDDFLVRDVQVFERDSFSKLIPHKPSDLSIQGTTNLAETVRDPFIYNPFSKAKSVAAAPVLVAEELATFAVVLQNPLEVDVEIDQIELITTGCEFTASKHSIVLGPFSTQTFTLTGRPSGSGDLEVIGCRASIRHCYPQDFLIFTDDWKLPSSPKDNAVGKIKTRRKPNGVPDEDIATGTNLKLQTPISTSLKLRVINPQPRLTIQPTNFDSAAMMLLEGELRRYDFKMINESSRVSADFVLVTTQDSVTSRLQDTLENKDLLPADIYEIQTQLATNPVVQIENKDRPDSSSSLSPGQSINYTVAIVGRPGLVSATVQMDFAYLGAPSSEVKGNFYTRQVRYPISVTVNGSVEILRCNILPIHNDFSWNDKLRQTIYQNGDEVDKSHKRNIAHFSHWLKTHQDAHDHCILSLDVRNVWPQPLSIHIQARRPTWGDTAPDGRWNEAFSVLETLQPGHVSRILLLVPRLFIQDPTASIPNLGTQKQFVVSKSKVSAETEAASRESFWYREELIKCLRGTWNEEPSGRKGTIDLRKGIRLSSRMVDALKSDHVEIEYDLLPAEKSDAQSADESADGQTIQQIGRYHFAMKTEVFTTLSVRVHNRTRDTLRLLLRLQPSLRNQPHNIALDLSRRLAWTGVLQRALHPAIEPGGVCVAQLGIIALAQGDYEINASVEEVKGFRTDPPTVGSGRRMWHARSPCLIDAIHR